MAEPAPGLGFAMPTLQYNEDGWGPYEISDTFRDMPYQVKKGDIRTYNDDDDVKFCTPNMSGINGIN